jgi:hypothetical protein
MRAKLISDSFALSQAGIISSTIPFEILRYLSKETEYLPWNTALYNLEQIGDMIESTNIYSNYINYVNNLIQPLYNQVGWIEKDNESWLYK